MADRTLGKRDAALFIEHAFGLSRALRLNTIRVLANEMRLTDLVEKYRADEAVLWLAGGGIDDASRRDQDPVVAIPASRLTRMSRLALSGIQLPGPTRFRGVTDRPVQRAFPAVIIQRSESLT